MPDSTPRRAGALSPALVLLTLALVRPAVAQTPDLLICDFTASTVVRYDPDSGQSQVWIAAGSGGLRNPHSILRGADGQVLVLGETSGRIGRYSASTGAFLNALISGLPRPVDLDFGPGGDLYVLLFDGSVRVYDPLSGAFLRQFVPAGVQQLGSAEFMEFGPDSTGDGVPELYVTSATTGRVWRFDGRSGAFVDFFVPAGSGGLQSGQGHRFRGDGFYYVANGNGNDILRFDAVTGAFDRAFVSTAAGLSFPHDIAFDGAGNLYVTEPFSGRVTRFDGVTGQSLGVVVSPATAPIRAANAILFLPDCPASWQTYGAATPGTGGAPELSLAGLPVLGGTATFSLTGTGTGAAPATGALVLGLTATATPLSGGTLLAAPDLVQFFTMPAGGTSIGMPVPASPLLCGLSVYGQLLQLDGGAQGGIAMSQGLQAVLGDG